MFSRSLCIAVATFFVTYAEASIDKITFFPSLIKEELLQKIPFPFKKGSRLLYGNKNIGYYLLTRKKLLDLDHSIIPPTYKKNISFYSVDSECKFLGQYKFPRSELLSSIRKADVDVKKTMKGGHFKMMWKFGSKNFKGTYIYFYNVLGEVLYFSKLEEFYLGSKYRPMLVRSRPTTKKVKNESWWFDRFNWSMGWHKGMYAKINDSTLFVNNSLKYSHFLTFWLRSYDISSLITWPSLPVRTHDLILVDVNGRPRKVWQSESYVDILELRDNYHRHFITKPYTEILHGTPKMPDIAHVNHLDHTDGGYLLSLHARDEIIMLDESFNLLWTLGNSEKNNFQLKGDAQIAGQHSPIMVDGKYLAMLDNSYVPYGERFIRDESRFVVFELDPKKWQIKKTCSFSLGGKSKYRGYVQYAGSNMFYVFTAHMDDKGKDVLFKISMDDCRSYGEIIFQYPKTEIYGGHLLRHNASLMGEEFVGESVESVCKTFSGQ